MLMSETETDEKRPELGNFKVVPSNEKILVVKTLLDEIKREEKEELHSKDSVVDTVKPVAKEIIKIFQEGLSEEPKKSLKTMSKFVSVLTNSKFKILWSDIVFDMITAMVSCKCSNLNI